LFEISFTSLSLVFVTVEFLSFVGVLLPCFFSFCIGICASDTKSLVGNFNQM
jgi:hypothetical protein